jgi:O-antigen ligase
MRKSAWVMSGLLVVGLLWPIHSAPQGSFQGEWLAICGFLLAGLMVVAAPPRTSVPGSQAALTLPLSVLALAPMGLMAALLAALGSNPVERAWTIQALIYLGMAAIAAFLGATLSRAGYRKEVLATFAYAWLVASLLNLLAQAIQALGIEALFAPFVFPLEGSVHGRPYGNIAQPNLLGSLFGIGLACLAWLHQEQRIRTPFAAVMAVLLLLGLATTASRMVIGFVPVFAVCALLIPGPPAVRRRRFLVVLGASALFLLLHAGLPHVIQAFNETSRTTSRLSDFSTTGRSRLWPVTLELIRSHPWFGVGPGQFARGFAEANLALGGVSDGLVHHSHNLVLQLAAEYGLIGVVATLATLIWVGFRQLRRAADTDEQEVPDRLLVLAVMGLLAVHSQFEFPLWYAFFLLPLAFLVGAVDRAHAFLVLSTRSSAVGALLLAGLLGCGGWAAWDFRSAQRMMSGFLSARPEGAEVAALELATDRFSLFASQREYVRFMLTPAEAAAHSPRLPQIRSAVMRHAFPKALTRLAVVEALGGDTARGRKLVQLANAMYPEFAKSRRQDLLDACAALSHPGVCALSLAVTGR